MNCLYGWKLKGKHQWYSDRKQTTIWEYDRPKANKDHPTMKPIGLMSYPIRNSTMTNGIVLDPFLGSGSTLIAVRRLTGYAVALSLTQICGCYRQALYRA
jgi:site-specific DNA-methyltransferase (adenine-specific)